MTNPGWDYSIPGADGNERLFLTESKDSIILTIDAQSAERGEEYMTLDRLGVKELLRELRRYERKFK